MLEGPVARVETPEREAKSHNQQGRREPFPRNTGPIFASIFHMQGEFRDRDRRCWRPRYAGCRLILGYGRRDGKLVFGNCFSLVHSHGSGVRLNESFVEDPARKLIKLFLLNGEEESGTNLGGKGYLLKGYLALLPFPL
jgi:hypothetical protein